jgi:putative methyltransferase
VPSNALKTILISEPNASVDEPYLPYLWAVLKSYFERHGAAVAAYEWLEPIYQRGDPEPLLAPYQGRRIDVLGLSCYTWNWDIQWRLAQHVKAHNPDCVVVAGGPDPDYKDPAFFLKHPYIDVVVVNDGEIPFMRILETLADGDRARFRAIPGLYLPGVEDRRPTSTGRAEVPKVFDHSPYIDQAAYLEPLAKSRGPRVFGAVWETNRGCPYSCSYCDWGSNTMSKVRRFDMERVKAEAEWIARMQTSVILLVDANFGIFPRDIEITEHLCAARTKYGFPRGIYYSPAKNNPERSIEIARQFKAAGFIDCHFMAVQHTRKEVLAATDRENISAEKQKDVAKALQSQNIPITVQLILGIPGDTYDLWKSCFADLMEWGIHDDYQVFPYILLPNAPAAEKEFRERWEMETTECVVTTNHQAPRSFAEGRGLTSQVVTRSKTYSHDDWVRMNVFATFARVFHARCLTRWIALYLRHTHGVCYRAFYDDLVDDFMTAPGQRRLTDAVARHCREAVAQEAGFDQMAVEELPHYHYYLTMSQWAFVQICLEFEDFWASLRSHLLGKYPGIAPLEDLINYQKNLVVLPRYDPDTGKSFRVQYDWPEYFERVAHQEGQNDLGEPRRAPGAEVVASDKVGGPFHDIAFNWNRLSGEARWITWIKQTVAHRACASKNNHTRLKLTHRGAAPARRPLSVFSV